MFSAYAVEEKNVEYGEISNLIASLGITESNATKTSPMTRAEFVYLLVKMMDLNMATPATAVPYKDIDGHWAENEIKVAYYLGIISDGGFFEPDEVLNYNQAIKIMVCYLGYGEKALAKGGWSMGYLLMAAELKLTSGISNNDSTISRPTIDKLLFNALTINLMIFDGNVKYKVVSDKTILSEYLRCYKLKGQITANEYTSLYGERARRNEVEIDGTRYNEGYSNAGKYLGYRATFYIREVEGNNDEVVAIYNLENENDVITINADDIEDTTADGVRYLDEKNATKNVRLGDDKIIVYNGVVLSSYTPADYFPSEGEITLLDSNSDGRYDIIFTDDIEIYVFSAYNSVADFITGKYQSDAINLDDAERYSIEFNGIEIEPAALTEGQILEVMQSKDKKTIKINVVSLEVEGEIVEENDDAVVVGDAEYKISPSFKNTGKTLKTGDNGTFYLTSDKKIAAFYAVATGKNLFGYLANMKKKKGLTSEIVFKIMTIDDGMMIYNSSPKLLVNSRKYTNAEDKIATIKGATGSVNQLISYSLDADERVTQINTVNSPSVPELNRKMEIKTLRYSSGARTFYETIKDANNAIVAVSRILLTTKTTVFVVPTNSSDDKAYSVGKHTYFVNGSTYTLEVFGEADKISTSFVVAYVDVAENESNLILTRIRPAVFDKITRVMIDDELFYKIYVYIQGQYTSLLLYDYDSIIQTAKNLARGDVIRYSADPQNRIIRLEQIFSQKTKLYKANGERFQGSESSTAYGHTGYATLYDREDNVILLRFSDGTIRPYVMAPTHYIYMYDSGADRVIAYPNLSEAILDKTTNNGDKVFFRAENVIADLVICR